MTIGFIADCHLSIQDPKQIQRFTRFLNTKANAFQALYILGDLFNVWVGDDINLNDYDSIINALYHFNTPKPRTYFIEGNRDFLLGTSFFQKSRCTYLPNPSRITLFNQNIVISHGDELCTDDISYQRLRRLRLNPLVRSIFLKLPKRLRLNIAHRLRNYSAKNAKLSDININDFKHLLNKEKVNTLIHGHTHQPAIEIHYQNKKTLFRYTLSDWAEKGNVLTWDEKGKVRFHYFS